MEKIIDDAKLEKAVKKAILNDENGVIKCAHDFILIKNNLNVCSKCGLAYIDNFAEKSKSLELKKRI